MKVYQKRFWVACFAACIIFSTHTAFAASARSYQVEMIIFSHLTKDALNSEKWPAISAPSFNSEQLTPENQLNHGEKMLLGELRNRLAGQANYQVLMHISWVMTSSHPNQAIHIYGGKIFDRNGNALGNLTNGTDSYNDNNIWQVNGSVKISLDRFFDVNFNLYFAEPKNKIFAIAGNNSLVNTADNFVYFRLKQHRRMRSNELNYISMPMYGVLIKIIPLDAR